MTGKPDLVDRIVQIVIAAAGFGALAMGLFMFADPLGWYSAIPTVSATGPANSHFIRDIAAAFLASGIMLLFAAANPAMRWLAALAGAFWPLLHGLVHVYEVSAGICSPGLFWSDAPGVLGMPLLVIAAVLVQIGRQRITPAGLPDGVILRAMAKGSDASETQYLRELAGAPGRAFEKFKHFMPATRHRHEAPAVLFHAARIGATLAEDCGPCVAICARAALADGLPRERIEAWIAGKASANDEANDALAFGRAIATQSVEAFDLGDRIELAHGRTTRLELAFAAALVRAYPSLKRGLGLTQACSVGGVRF